MEASTNIVRKTTDTFSFDVPDDWKTFVEDRRFVAQGPNGEEFILSSWAPQPLSGSRPQPQVFEELLDALVENAKRAASRGADHPALRITKALSSAPPAGGLYACWTLLAEDPEIFFGQAVVRGPSAVMLATFEASLSADCITQFNAFLNSFGAPFPRA